MQSLALQPIDIIVVFTYMVFIIWLGIKYGKKQKDVERYFLGEKKLPGWAVGFSMFATIISSWSFMALPGKSFKNDLQYLMTISTLLLSAFLTAKYMIPIYREKIKISAYEFLEQRFGLGARIYGNVAFIIVHFGKMGAILYLICMAITGMTGWNIFILITVIGTATIIYTFYGGIEGVIWSDVIQGILLLFGGIVSVLFILFGSNYGAEEIIIHSFEAGKLKLVSLDFSIENAGSIAVIFFGFNYFFQKYVSDQTVVQRFLLSPSEKEASKSLWMSSIIIVFVWALFMFIGALLWSYYNLQPELLPAVIRDQPDKVFPYFIGHQLPPGITGVVLTGLLAATMSTLSSDLNSLSAVIYDDYYSKFSKGKSEKARFLFSRGTVLISGVLSITFAMAMTQIKSMADAAFNFVSLVAGGVLGMYLLGFFTKRTNTKGLFIGLVTGIIFILWTYFGNTGENVLISPPPINTLWIGIFGNLVVIVVGYFTSKFFSINNT